MATEAEVVVAGQIEQGGGRRGGLQQCGAVGGRGEGTQGAPPFRVKGGQAVAQGLAPVRRGRCGRGGWGGRGGQGAPEWARRSPVWGAARRRLGGKITPAWDELMTINAARVKESVLLAP
jgi:hypothetical protein